MGQFEQVHKQGDVNYIARFGNGEFVTALNDNPEPITNLDSVRPARTVSLRRSTDHGATWSDPAVAFAYPAGTGFSMPVASVVDQSDRLHVFGLRFLALSWGVGPSRSELLHTYSDDRGLTWSDTNAIDFGQDYTGSINNVIVLNSGRILLPLSYLDPDRQSGKFVSMAVYSDDCGETWRYSNSCPIVGGGDFPESGSLEPVVVELNSGLVWMVIRTVGGYFWESFSNDGSVWTPPQPTRIVSPNAPAGVVRLSSGAIAMSWNNRYGEPMRENGISYARQELSLAISRDDGQTWSVPKIIARINDDDSNDVQTTYPYLMEAADGTLIVVYHVIRKSAGRTWHNPIREVLRIDPAWIDARQG
jgi:hypothetical protein